jgi:hypothetical protein
MGRLGAEDPSRGGRTGPLVNAAYTGTEWGT